MSRWDVKSGSPKCLGPFTLSREGIEFPRPADEPSEHLKEFKNVSETCVFRPCLEVKFTSSLHL